MRFPRVTRIRFLIFWGVMLVLISFIYADKFGRFECSVNFWQLVYLDVFWFVFDFCLFQKIHQRSNFQGWTVNKEYYLQVMRNLREAIRQKRPDLWKNKNWLLHHDNVLAHTSLLVREFLSKNNTLMLAQPPYSSDLAPFDFFLIPRLKTRIEDEPKHVQAN